MQRLLEAARKACLPAIWSQGVKLARDGAVSRAASAKGELSLCVRAPGHAVAPSVTLYREELEWSCDCGGKVDPCAHVAAAVIAMTSSAGGAVTTGRAAVEIAPSARLVYRLGTKGRLLTLARRVLHGDGREERLDGLASHLARG